MSFIFSLLHLISYYYVWLSAWWINQTFFLYAMPFSMYLCIWWGNRPVTAATLSWSQTVLGDYWLMSNIERKKNGWAHSIKAQHWMPLLQNIVKNLERQEVRDWLQNTREILEGEKKVAIYIFLCRVFREAFHFKSIKLLSSSVDWLFEQSKAPW